MNENDFLTLVRRWQDPGSWVTVEALGFNAADFEAMADNLGADARICLDRGDIAAASELKAEADHLRKCAADVLGQRSELASQFMQIENWVREHRPELLEFVPIAAFSGEPSEAIRDLKRLESRIQKPAATEPPSIPVVRTFSKWQELLSWSPTTWIRRRKDFPDCFTDVPGENACSIREPELSLWLASAENKNRSPFEKA